MITGLQMINALEAAVADMDHYDPDTPGHIATARTIDADPEATETLMTHLAAHLKTDTKAGGLNVLTVAIVVGYKLGIAAGAPMPR